MSRIELWRQLRAAIRDGNGEEAERVAKSLGFLKPARRRRLLEKLWKQQTRRQP